MNLDDQNKNLGLPNYSIQIIDGCIYGFLSIAAFARKYGIVYITLKKAIGRFQTVLTSYDKQVFVLDNEYNQAEVQQMKARYKTTFKPKPKQWNGYERTRYKDEEVNE